jgi:hypothetical protein
VFHLLCSKPSVSSSQHVGIDYISHRIEALIAGAREVFETRVCRSLLVHDSLRRTRITEYLSAAKRRQKQLRGPVR